MPISPRSVKTIPGRYSHGGSWRAGYWRLAGCQRVAFYLNGRPSYQPVDSAELLDTLALWLSGHAGDDPAQQKRVIMAFQMHFRPARWDGVADAETQAIAEALLEKYGQDNLG
jgi:N-acetyl-anhydromuramyl-L-alanine amidase AmpD